MQRFLIAHQLYLNEPSFLWLCTSEATIYSLFRKHLHSAEQIKKGKNDFINASRE
jgi:hypothetical protein